MKKAISFRLRLLAILPISSILFTPFASAQEIKNEYYLLGKCIGVCGYDKLEEISYQIKGALSDNKKVVIKLSSDENFETAIAKSSRNISVISKELLKIFPSNVLVLQNGCNVKCDNVGIMEIYALSPESPLPEYKKKIELENIAISYINQNSYQSNVHKFVKELQNNPSSYGFIIGYFFDNPSRNLKKNLLNVKKLLKNKLPQERYSLIILSLGETSSPPSPEPKELDILTVKIKN